MSDTGELTHVSSLLLRAEPARLDDVVATIGKVDIAEVALSDPEGRIIVTLETASEADIVATMTQFQLIDGVVSAALVYHQTDEAQGQT